MSKAPSARKLTAEDLAVVEEVWAEIRAYSSRPAAPPRPWRAPQGARPDFRALGSYFDDLCRR
jgi:hypothetical protein